MRGRAPRVRRELERRAGTIAVAVRRRAGSVGIALSRLSSRGYETVRGWRPAWDRWLPRDPTGVRHARLDLLRARVRHHVLVLGRRVTAVRAERTHRHALRQAERELRATEKDVARAVAKADERLRGVMKPRRLAEHGPFALFDDSLKGPDWEVSLASVRALVVPSDAVALKGGGSGALPHPPAAPSRRQKRPELVVQSRKGLSAHAARDDAQADEFAHLLNVAALNAGRFDEARRAETDAAAEALDRARAEGMRLLADARSHLDSATADTARLAEARRLLLRAELDTSEIDRCRAAVDALELAGKRR